MPKVLYGSYFIGLVGRGWGRGCLGGVGPTRAKTEGQIVSVFN